MSNKPHILIFNPDQWRGDVLGHMGNPAAVTPNLDRFVETDGVSFRNAFTVNPVCTPSRCCFMSGWYSHVRGHRTMYHMMRPDEPVLLRTLLNNGYFVWWGGKNDLVPAQNGYEGYCDVKYKPARPLKPGLHTNDAWRGGPEGDNYYSFYCGKLEPVRQAHPDTIGKPVEGKDKGEQTYYDYDWAMVQGAIEHIRSAPADKPQCIYLPLTYPHPPYGVEEPYYSMIDREMVPPRIPAPASWVGQPSMLAGIHERQKLHSWSEERWRELRATYYGMCARVDAQFGLVTDALREAGMYDDTAVFFFSDHGDFTGDYGIVEKTQNVFKDCGVRVPFLVKPPAGVPIKPRVSDALVELIDFPATVEALTGIEPGHTHFGRSLLPVLAGQTDEHRDAVFCEGGRVHGETQCMELESHSSQNPSGLYWPRISLQTAEGPEHTKAVMVRTTEYKYVRRLYESDELYDLKRDPAELDNRIDDPALAEPLRRLRDRLLTFYLRTGDTVPHDTDRRW